MKENNINKNGKDKPIPLNNYFNQNNSDSKSTVKDTNGSSTAHINNNINTSRTHDSFFPKIKNSFELDENENHLSEINKKFNSNNVIINMNKNNNHNNRISKDLESLYTNNIKLEDGISLSIIKNNTNYRVKKFFSVPNFEIYFIKEIPMSSKFFVANFKEKLNYWNRVIGDSTKYLKIYNEYVNNPEG